MVDQAAVEELVETDMANFGHSRRPLVRSGGPRRTRTPKPAVLELIAAVLKLAEDCGWATGLSGCQYPRAGEISGLEPSAWRCSSMSCPLPMMSAIARPSVTACRTRRIKVYSRDSGERSRIKPTPRSRKCLWGRLEFYSNLFSNNGVS